MEFYSTNSEKSKLILRSVCAYTIFYETDNNLFPSMEQHASSETLVNSGVPTESVLGSLVFLIRISDINNELADSIVSCFADDTRILL